MAHESIVGVETSSVGNLYCKKLVITTGTFLSGVIYRGKEKWKAGRLNARPSFDLAKFFKIKNIKHIVLKQEHRQDCEQFNKFQQMYCSGR